MNVYEENKIIEKAVDVIKNRGVVILPADTVYGIFGGLFFPNAVERVYKIKGRERHKPFGICCTNTNVQDLSNLNPTARILMDHFWPGPLSIILNKKKVIPKLFTDNPTVLLLSPKNRILSEVVKRSSIPIFSTTCNFSGDEEITESRLLHPFKNLVDFIGTVDNFPFHLKVSTIVNCVQQPPKVVRCGAIEIQQIRNIIPTVEKDLDLLIR
ncbi:L-threonylcarbamoyladenylate synthase [Pleurocapsa sp. PCC 7319]|uniref:L-threonylcarbamoyladenylate synthase n=1 Tax=Pleurocapsa sp. PCC 7319 TaxID=118161 RepID=UPI00034B8ACC|nr:L-threonylcarbamoyladenylate synthase [Pleurocapsa sp. PCC 7319]